MQHKGQSGSGQNNDSPDSIVISHVPVGNNKAVMISQIMDTSLLDDEDNELEDSVPPSMYGKRSLIKKQFIMPATEPRCLGKDEMVIPLIVQK